MRFGEFILQAFLPLFAQYGSMELANLLRKLQAKKPEVFETILVSLYPIIDVHLEQVSKESKTKIDDPFVTAFKNAIEMVAMEYGITLPNLDAGEIGD